jgi:hypothetical protein
MKYIKNNIASFHCVEELQLSLTRLCETVRRSPLCLEPFRGVEKKMEKVFAEGGFQLYPTVRSTTLLYDAASECFLKVLHPLKLKSRIFFALTDKARSIYNISGELISRDVKTVRVLAYGKFRKGSRPFFVCKKAEGRSLKDILLTEGETPGMGTYLNVIGEVSRLHNLGYWFGDAHLSHIFIKEAQVSGIIDIDSIRKNRFFLLENLAKDIAGLNHPDLPLTEDEKKDILDNYIKAAGIKNEKKFIRLLKHYTEQRWKD